MHIKNGTNFKSLLVFYLPEKINNSKSTSIQMKFNINAFIKITTTFQGKNNMTFKYKTSFHKMLMKC